MSFESVMAKVARATPAGATIRFPTAAKFEEGTRAFLEEQAARGDGPARAVVGELKRHEGFLRQLREPKYRDLPAAKRAELIEQSGARIAEAYHSAVLEHVGALHEAAGKARQAYEDARYGTGAAATAATLRHMESVARLQGMGDGELESAAAVYREGGGDFEPAEADALARELRSRGKGREADAFRQAAVNRGYDAPWAREQAAEAELRYGNYSPDRIVVRVHGQGNDGREMSGTQSVRIENLINPVEPQEIPEIGGAS